MDQNTNPPSSNPNPATPTAPGQTPAATPPVTPPPGQPAGPTTPPTEGTGNANPMSSQQPGQTGTTPPANNSKKGMIIAIVVFLVLLVAAAALLLTQQATTQPEQQPVPSTSVENTAPTLAPTQSVEEEIDAVDTGASESSDLKEVEEDINSLQPTTVPANVTTTP